MPVSKIFTYMVEGLSYTVTVYEQDGGFFADIAVIDGAMDVNGIYFGDDDFSGDSASLGGSLNMNGARLDGEPVQWDDAVALSRPGLGRDGTDKETYLEAGDTLTVQLDITSLDDIDVFGIRATSTTTDAGSIKGVSDDPVEHVDPEEPVDPDEPTFDKVFFGAAVDEQGGITDGLILGTEDLPEGTEPTFANYLAAFEENEFGYDVQSIETVVFYELDPTEGFPVELFRIDAPEDGFRDSEELLAAYDEAIEAGALDDAASEDTGGTELIAALTLEPEPEDEPVLEEDSPEPDMPEVLA